MINSEDTETIKGLVVSALLLATGDFKTSTEVKPHVEKAFDIVIKEMKQGNI